jgi:DNA-binding transcriptional MerR regulator
MAVDLSTSEKEVFKAAHVCSLAGIQPYILRSWEAEFPALAQAETTGGTRVYRRADVEMVLRIKSLVFGEGLTLGAARRKLLSVEDGAQNEPQDVGFVWLLDSTTREMIDGAKQGLREILDLLTAEADPHETDGVVPTTNAVKQEPGEPFESSGPSKRTKTMKVVRSKKVAKGKRSA